MASDEKEMKDCYKNLKAVDYIEYMVKTFDDAPEMLRFILIFIRDVLESGRFKGSSALEIGCGAVVHNIATASAYYSRIVMGDLVQDNCDELKRWLQGKSQIRQFLDIPAELEGYANDLEAGKRILVKRIRKCVKQVVRCDVSSDNVFLEDLTDEAAPPYDLIISIFTLESAAFDFDNYLQNYQRINRLLRVGGGLIICGCFRGKRWSVKDTVFPHLDIGKEDLLAALKGSGFGIIDMKLQDKLPIVYEYEQMYCLVAEKLL